MWAYIVLFVSLSTTSNDHEPKLNYMQKQIRSRGFVSKSTYHGHVYLEMNFNYQSEVRMLHIEEVTTFEEVRK